MDTALYIAKRYLFSRKKMHAINIISGISMLGVFVGSAALLIILSAFNGLEDLILSSYSHFSPELKIEPAQGKTFDPNTAYFKALHKDPRVLSYTEVLQEKALMMYGDKQFIGTILGVSDEFMRNRQLDSTIRNGSFTLHSGGEDYGVIGLTIQSNLDMNIKDRFADELQIYSPRRNVSISANPLSQLKNRRIHISGIFSIQQAFDDMMITPISFTRDLLDEPVAVSAINLNFKPGADISKVQKEISEKAGNKYIIKSRVMQNSALYKTLKSEGWSVYMILTFIVVIAVFNIIGSLTMLVMDKQKDIAILTSLGAGRQLIQGIFFYEGMMIAITGCLVGLFAGGIFCVLQHTYGFIKMGSTLTITDAYPVVLKFIDFIIVFLTVTIISVIASGISARLSVKRLDEIKKEL